MAPATPPARIAGAPACPNVLLWLLVVAIYGAVLAAADCNVVAAN